MRGPGDQDPEQGIELGAAVLTGNGKAEVAVWGATGILYEWRVDSRRQEGALQAGGLSRVPGDQEHNRPGRFGQRQAGLAQACFHVSRISQESAPQGRICFEGLHSRQCRIGQRQGRVYCPGGY